MLIKDDGDTLTMSSGDGAPMSGLVIGLFGGGIATLVLVGHLWQAIVNGWGPGWGALLICPIMIYVSGQAMFATANTTLTADKRFGTVMLERRFAHKTEHEKLKLDDIDLLDIDVVTDSDGDKSYKLVLHLKTGREITIGNQTYKRAEYEPALAAFQRLKG